MKGRDAELERLDRALATAAAGRATVVAVTGPFGLGKTALLDAVRAEAEQRRFVVLATQGRAGDAELGFASLLTLLRPLDGSLDQLAGDLATELRAGLAVGHHPADPAAVRLALVRVLSAVAATRPLLLLVDDAHLLDRASADALAFAVGRFFADTVLTVIAAEPSSPTAFDDVIAETITLEPLTAADLDRIVAAAVAMADGPRRRCVELADGNPLAALELASSLDAAQRAGHAPLPQIPRVTGVLARAFARRLEQLSDAARNALAVVAADDTGECAVVDAALQQLGEPDTGIAEAEAAGLVEVHAGAVRFAHPLLRPVSYHQVGVASRRAAHAALASVLDAAHQGPSRAWQLVAAADRPDESVAAALTLVADDVARRGGAASAARTLEYAAGLTPDAERRRDRLVAATQAWLDAFDPASAARTADALAELAPTPASLAAVARALLVARPAGVVLAHMTAAVEAVDPVERDEARRVLAGVLLAAGAPDEASAVAPDAAPLIDDDEVRRALATLATGDLAGAHDQLLRIDAIAPERAGLLRGPVDVALAEVEFLMGRPDDAGARAGVVAERAGALGLGWLRDRATAVSGRLALARGDAGAAVDLLRAAARSAPSLDGADLVDALQAASRPTEAAAVADRLRRFTDHDDPTVAVRACRALGAAGADAYFDQALERATRADLPLEAAAVVTTRAELTGSGALVSEAVARWSACGVSGWAPRLARLGEGPPVDPIASQLSPAEHRVAVAVAEGRTNQEAAETLYLSVKTIDFHLQNIYRKLGLRSRTELAVAMHGGALQEVPA